MMSDLLSRPKHGFHITAIEASSQSDLPSASVSVYPQVRLVMVAVGIKSPEHLMTLRYTTEDMSLTSAGGR